MKKYPDIQEAEYELKLAGELNPGPWVEHSKNTGLAAKYIAEKSGLNPEKAYVLGLLHDIGRRVGFVSQRHIIEGYRYCMMKGWEDAARICMTHSYMLPNIKADVGQYDVSEQDYDFMKHYIETAVYDDYDRLLQLCDGLALAQGFCLLEKRLIDIHRRYGVNEYTVQRWNVLFEIKEDFEARMGCSLYDVLPKVEEITFTNIPLYKPLVK